MALRRGEKSNLFILLCYAILFALFFLVILLVAIELASLRSELRILRDELNLVRKTAKSGTIDDQLRPSSSPETDDWREDEEETDDVPNIAVVLLPAQHPTEEEKSIPGNLREKRATKNQQRHGGSKATKSKAGGTNRGTTLAPNHPTKGRKKKKHKKGVIAAHLEGVANVANPNKGIFKHWQFAPWMTPKVKRLFVLGLGRDDIGKVTLQKEGIYFIYAQITYKDLPDSEFRIIQEFQNGTNKTLACCVHARHLIGTDPSVLTTCHTSSLSQISKGDKVYIKDQFGNNEAVFNASSSFFGFLKLR